jgi:hypothetical protein
VECAVEAHGGLSGLFDFERVAHRLPVDRSGDDHCGTVVSDLLLELAARAKCADRGGELLPVSTAMEPSVERTNCTGEYGGW